MNALSQNTTASNNTAIGRNALVNNTIGDELVAIGNYAGDAITDAHQCCFVGYNAGTNCTTGDDNDGFGKNAGASVTTGANNCCLGNDSGTSSSPATITTADNQIVIGNNSHAAAFIKVAFTVTSDERDKTDITDFTKGLDIIKSLRSVTYKWDMRSNYEDGKPDGSKKESKTHIGLIAQDVEKIEKANGYGDTNDNSLFIHKSDDGEKYSLCYEKLIPVLVNAIKELSVKVTALEAG